MPAGGTTLGFLYFAAAKYAGYSGFCRIMIEPQCKAMSLSVQRIPSAWKAGGIRTLIGIAIGSAVGISFWKIPYFSHHDPLDTPFFFLALVPIRVFEWWLLLKWIYKGFAFTPKQYLALILIGIVTSFALDGIGILAAFVLPGGAWVC